MLKETKRLIKKYHHSYKMEYYWMYLVCAFFLLLAGALFYSSWLFTNTTKTLDEPALATFESNASKLRAIEKSISNSEEAIRVRVGESTPVVPTEITSQ